MGVMKIQNDFTHGEIDPQALTRFDLDLYNRGALQLRNVVVQPLGGVKRRFGLKFIDIITATEDQYKLSEFDFDATTNYLMVWVDDEALVYKDDILVHTIPTTGYSGTEVSGLQFTQSFNIQAIAEPTTAPFQLTRGAGDTNWTLAAISLKNQPAHDFEKNYNAINFGINLPGVGVKAASTITASAAIFTADNVDAYFIGGGASSDVNNGFARIAVLTDTTHVTCSVISAFNSAYSAAGSMSGTDVLLTEVAWSATHGFPRTVVYFQGRLVWAGTADLPETFFASVSNDYTDYNIGVGDDSDAIQVTLSGASINRIKYLVAAQDLQFFCDGGVYAAMQRSPSVLTPANVDIKIQSNNAIADVEPQIIDNATIYVVEGGKRVEALRLDSSGFSYASEAISLLSSHVINAPVDSAVLQPTTGDQAHYYFLINGDGTLAVLQLIAQENVAAWTLSLTDGEFKRVQQVKDDIYFLIKRTIDGSDVTYLEKLDFTVFTDSTETFTSGSPTRTLTGFTHLIGETVDIVGDGFVLDQQVVDSAGTITLPASEIAVSTAVVGMPYSPTIETLPININSQNGPTAFNKKRISRIYVKFYQSLGIEVNGIEINKSEFGNDVLDQPPALQDGLVELPIIQGWDAEQTITITQPIPTAMQILGIGFEVEL